MSKKQELIDYMEQHKDVASLMPQMYYPNGKRQHLCKLLPTPLDLLGRRFLPRWVMKKRNRRYELRDTGYTSIMNVPYLSGCFMLLRSDALREVGLFGVVVSPLYSGESGEGPKRADLVEARTAVEKQ